MLISVSSSSPAAREKEERPRYKQSEEEDAGALCRACLLSDGWGESGEWGGGEHWGVNLSSLKASMGGWRRIKEGTDKRRDVGRCEEMRERKKNLK